MNLPVDLLHWLAAFAPIAMLLFLMIKRKWGIRAAAPVGLAVTVLTGLCFYKADLELILLQCGKGIWNALPILLIIATAILLYQVGEEAGAFPVIRNGMRKFLPNELLLVLAMGWILESFLQGITGFGVPVAVGAPLLMGIGVRPVWAVIIPLLGQSWGNTFGTLAVSWDMLAVSAGMEAGSEAYLKMAFWACVFLWIWNLVIGLVICWFYGRGRALKKGLPAVLLLSLVQGGGELLMTRVSTTLACFLPACASLILVIVLGRTGCYREEWRLEDSGIMVSEMTVTKDDPSVTDYYRAILAGSRELAEEAAATGTLVSDCEVFSISNMVRVDCQRVCKVTLSASDETPCEGEEITLTASPGSFDSYDWTGPGVSGNGNTQTVVVNEETTYKVSANGPGCITEE